MSRAILWFRTDLRILDNEALAKASARFDEIIPVYIFDPEYLAQSRYQAKKIDSLRLQFILQSLADLKKQLKAKGADLLVRMGDAANEIKSIAGEYEVDAVYAHKNVGTEEDEIEEKVKAALGENIELKLFWGHTLFHVNDLPFEYKQLPDVYTDFRKQCEKKAEVRPTFSAPETIKAPGGLEGEELPDLKAFGLEAQTIADKAAISLKGGEEEARHRLKHYLWDSEQLTVYKKTRNGLLGKDYSSKFSAWLAQGCISPRTICEEVKRYEKEIAKNQSTYWLVFELIWRDYFSYVTLKFGSKLFYPGGIRDESIQWKRDPESLEAWKEGRTGIPFIDANMRELNESGFMSNRGRQNVASFFVKDLRQDWRTGAAYFEQKLIDYDVASNWGNWAYVAGVGNDPRDDRWFNVISQAQRYDTEGKYVKHWIPALQNVDKQHIHTPWTLNQNEIAMYELDGTAYADPLFVSKKWKL